MVDVEFFHFAQMLESMLFVAKSYISESKHVVAMNDVLDIERIVPNKQIG